MWKQQFYIYIIGETQTNFIFSHIILKIESCKIGVFVSVWPGTPVLSSNMSGPFKRRPSIKVLPPLSGTVAGQKGSIRRQSSIGLKTAQQTKQEQEVPWDLLDRCLLPILFCHAAAVILSTILNNLYISQVSTLTLFIWFTITTVAAVLFYHNLKVNLYFKLVLIIF